MASRTWYLLLVIHVLLIAAALTSADYPEEKAVLMRFRESLLNATALDGWNESVRLCNWKGVLCPSGTFKGLRLEFMGLMGKIDVRALAALKTLYTISFMNNNFTGPMPDVKILRPLRSLYLANNQFSGEIPDDAFSGMKGMRRIILANNLFTGRIPLSLATLPKLVELQLQNNQFEGPIPDFPQEGLDVNFANNSLEGPIPAHLGSKNSSLFLGNNLCGKPLKPCKKHSIPKLAIVLTIFAAVSLLLIITISLICFCCRKKPSRYEKSTVENLHNIKASHDDDHHHAKRIKYPNHANNYKNNPNGKLYFVKSRRERFELDDLLKAPAELLGSGSFGSSYKADLFNGETVVVKRFRQMSNVGREEFHEHMRRLGRLSHPNLLPLVAFYYRKEEKLLITDFVANGSLANHLHCKRSPNQAVLDWPTRLKIIKGVARGLAYLYKELPGLTTPHGHLKSSNVLLDQTFTPILADYALVPVINKEHAQQLMVAYKSPEFTRRDRLTRRTDVWSLGILILELLTGKFPANYLKQGKGANADLATWVESVVREEWIGEVLDKDMEAANAEGEMLKLLKIGMCCCEWDEERRWGLEDAVGRIEDLKERDDNFDDSEADFYSSKSYD